MFKKKKIFYEKENCWVVLCKHDDKIPLLEWYPSSLAVENHKPAQVADLLNVSYISQPIGEDRAFRIGFDDPQREPLELVSLSLDECSIWIELMRETLLSLNCLPQNVENIYTMMPENELPKDDMETNDISGSGDENLVTTQSNEDNAHTFSCSQNSMKNLISFNKELNNSEENSKRALIESSLSNNEDALRKCENDNNEELKKIEETTNAKRDSIYNIPEVEGSQSTTLRPSTAPSTCSSSSPTYSVINSLHDSVNTLIPNSKNTLHPLSDSTTRKIQGYRFGIRPKNPPSKTQEQTIPTLPPRSCDDTLFNQTSSHSSPAKNIIKEKYYDVLNVSSPESNSSTSNLIYDKLYKPFKRSTASTTSSDNETCSSLADSIASMTLNNLLPLKTSKYRTNLNEVHSTDFYDQLPVLLNVPQSLNTSDAIYDTLPIESADLLNEHRIRNLSLVYTVLAEHIVFVEISGRVFVGGWTTAMHPKLVGLLHVGDEIIECDNTSIKDLEHFNNILCQHDLSGNAVSLRIRSIPFGKVFFIKKVAKSTPEQLLSLIIKRKKNVITNDNKESIEKTEDVSCGNNINSKQGITYESTTIDSSSPVITELNDKPTNIFATTDDHLYRRIDKLPKNSHFSIIVHPRDFSRLIKANIKQSPTFLRFIHDQ
uniref:PH domain-containing protein n=1 Tax=Parastrongyloides trichosuri TaxID=131310 RepID=A0A0N4ZB14_PARTI